MERDIKTNKTDGGKEIKSNLLTSQLPDGASPHEIFNYWNRVRKMPWDLPKPPDMKSIK